jgi:hypothetical protein
MADVEALRQVGAVPVGVPAAEADQQRREQGGRAKAQEQQKQHGALLSVF